MVRPTTAFPLQKAITNSCELYFIAAAPLAAPMCIFEFLSCGVTVWYSMQSLRIGRSWKLGFDKSLLHYIIFKQGELGKKQSIMRAEMTERSRFTGVMYFCVVSIFTISATILQFVSRRCFYLLETRKELIPRLRKRQ